MERPSESELTELVTDHVFGHVNRDELLAVVHGESQTDKIRKHRRTARPSLDYLAIRALASDLNLFNEMAITKRAFFN